MNQRLVFSALTIDLFVALWTGGLFVLSIAGIFVSADLFLFLAEISVPLAILGLGMTLIGIWRGGTMRLRTCQFLVLITLFATFCAWLSLGYTIRLGQWAASECGYMEAWKCTLAQAAGYADFYFLPNLAALIVTIAWGFAWLERLSVNSSHSPNPTNLIQTHGGDSTLTKRPEQSSTSLKFGAAERVRTSSRAV